MRTDITQAHAALMQFLYRSPIGLVQATLDGAIEMINPMAAQLLMPLSNDGGLDNLFTILQGVAPQLGPLVTAFEAQVGTVCESLRIGLDASARIAGAPHVLSLNLLKLDATTLMAVLSDATFEVQREQRALARTLNDAARTDALTRMPNRAAVREAIERALHNAKSGFGTEFAVLFMNCDRFKQINDAHGYAVGDEIMGLLANRLRANLRRTGRDLAASIGETTAARVGGDEFVVLVDELAHADDVHSVTQRLLDVLCKPYGIGASQLSLGVSIGIVSSAQAADNADQVLLDSSTAMIEAKRAGGSRYKVFEPEMRQRAARRAAVEAELRVALAEKQLFVVYQPVVGLQVAQEVDHKAGVEALVRWRHPLRGIVPPFEFIDIAEECGLIDAIGEFVLTTACRQMMCWQRELGPRAPRLLAVNLSRAQLRQPHFADTVRDILIESGMSPARLQLEVTESLAAQDDLIQACLHQLKKLGLTLALDDFGTGYSSLASLHLLPVDTVKIDRSFVSQSASSLHHRVLVEATIRVAKSLGMSTVAEGIETAEQANLVRDLGCDKGQGYLYSKPLTAADLSTWLAVTEAKCDLLAA